MRPAGSNLRLDRRDTRSVDRNLIEIEPLGIGADLMNSAPNDSDVLLGAALGRIPLPSFSFSPIFWPPNSENAPGPSTNNHEAAERPVRGVRARKIRSNEETTMKISRIPLMMSLFVGALALALTAGPTTAYAEHCKGKHKNDPGCDSGGGGGEGDPPGNVTTEVQWVGGISEPVTRRCEANNLQHNGDSGSYVCDLENPPHDS